MRKFFILFTILAFANSFAQIVTPVKWKTKTEKISETEFHLIFEGTIDKDWHVYSQFTPDGGPLPIELKYLNQEGNYNLIGKTKESKSKKEFNDTFGVDEIYFEKKVILTQSIKIKNTSISTIEAEIDYQVCKTSCINDHRKFKFIIPQTVVAIPETSSTPIAKIDTVQTVKEVKTTVVETKKVTTQKKVVAEKKVDKKGLWSIFFLAFLSGFAALLTPCVFPMIPMTVSFFTKQSKTKGEGKRNALFYGISIIIIYVVLGLLVTWIFGADALNALSTNVWFNIIFFSLLVFFAASFLGAFEIILPHSWANKVDSQADRGGIIGILFMALALAMVSFSCTGPIVGTLLVQAASKGGIAPIIGMFGFSLALALPFMLFAMFPGWLNSLPKSGGWLNTVKVVLGFLELALAFKFLSNADLVLQLHLLEREVFIAIWIAIFGTLTLYLFGKIILPHDSPLTHISVGRLMFGLLVLTFTVYLIPGLWGAPLKLTSGYLPPIEYSESPLGIGISSVNTDSIELPEGAKYGSNQILIFDDYEKGLAYAKTVNKPIMIDFTGFACVNCRKMENNVWTDKSIVSILKNDVVLISLYVDDKRELPINERFTSKTGAEIETIGDKWTDFMISKYNTNTQPLYVITDWNGTNLNLTTPTISYTPNIPEYEKWLKTGISNFKK